MWNLLGILLMNFTVALSFKNESFEALKLIEILRNKPLSISEQCQTHLLQYAEGILGGQEWALRMIDSMTKFPDGILIGHTVIPGQFDECVNAINGTFSGKHCMASLSVFPQQRNSYHIFSQKENNLKLKFSYGICFPSTCRADEIEEIIGSVEDLKSIIEIKVSEKECSVSGYRSFRSEDWITVVILVFICLLAVASTSYDLFLRFKRKNENPSLLWSSFSVCSNGKQLFRISQSSSQLKCLHGIRFLSMSWVILAHAYFTHMMGVPMNVFDLPKFLTDKSFVPISNGFVSVDSFFFLSGLLVCLVFFRDISKKGSFDVPLAFIHRYMRLTPPFAILMLIQATLISRIGNGPFWHKIDAVENSCRESWWAGLLYIQNFLKPKAMCLGQSWYLSADMQMYWISPLILYPLWWFPTFAPYFLLLLTLTAAFTSFGIAYVKELAPNLFFDIGSKKNEVFFFTQFESEYVTFYTRMAPWFIGMATGYIICGLQSKKIRLNLTKLWIVAGWIAAAALLGGSLFGIIRFISSQYSQAESSFYLAFHRVGWALGLSWVVVACVSGHGGIINDFLSLDFFQPLAKLSYCNFLVHMTLQNYKIFNSRTNQYLRHFDIVYGYFADLLFSNLISVAVTLLFEFPFSNIDRHFFQKMVIFPFPRVEEKIETKKLNEKLEKPVEPSKDVEEGKVNPSFVES